MADHAVHRWDRWIPVSDVPGYEDWPGYQVNPGLGLVRSMDRTLPDGRRRKGKILKQTINSHGYPKVTLRGGQRSRTVRVHVLVMAATDGPCPPGLEIAHGPRGQACPARHNLRYTTHGGNEGDKAWWSGQGIRHEPGHDTDMRTRQDTGTRGHDRRQDGGQEGRHDRGQGNERTGGTGEHDRLETGSKNRAGRKRVSQKDRESPDRPRVAPERPRGATNAPRRVYGPKRGLTWDVGLPQPRNCPRSGAV